MDKTNIFDINAAAYHRVRPFYPIALFDDIKKYSCINPNDNILEIGFGTGQATRAFINDDNHVYAIEKGKNLYEYAKQSLKNVNKLVLINNDYLKHQFPNDHFQLIYSASAFHWLDERLSYPLVYDQLKEKGTVALFWNHPFVADKSDQVHQAIQMVYKQYGYKKEPIPFSKEQLNKVTNLLASNNFREIVTKIYHNTRTMNALDYIDLLSTYSDHHILLSHNEFKKAIIKAINDNGNMIKIYDTIDLYLAKK